MKSLQFLLIGVVALTISAAASAEVLFDNFGPGDTYQYGYGMTLSDGSPVGTDYDQGSGFDIVGGNYYLDSIEAAIGFVTGQNIMNLTLYDDAGGVPGTPLEHVQVVGMMGNFGSVNPPVRFDFSGTTLLLEGALYWAIASTEDNSWSAWCFNDQGDVGPNAFRQDMGAWSSSVGDRAAFRVLGTIPGPGALALLALGGLVSRRRR